MSLIKDLVENNFNSINNVCHDIIAEKIAERVSNKKIEILARINGKSVQQMAESLELSENFESNVEDDDVEYPDELDELTEKVDPKAAIRSKKSPIFDNGSKWVNDDKDHFPIFDENHARNALARVFQYSSKPSWFTGKDLKQLQKIVVKKVHSKFPDIELSDKHEELL